MKKELEALGGVDSPSLSNFWNWVKRAFTISYQDEIESYLADSVDYVDFDNRMRNLQRRGMI
jgi:hypothetical protein